MDEPQNIYYQKNHEQPYRIYLKQGNSYQQVLDLQIKAELQHLDNPIKQEHSLSVYLKPPVNARYRLHSRWYKQKQIAPDKLTYEMKTIKRSIFRNPYISWHGSGELHANAYKQGNDTKTHRIIANKPAISWRDVRMKFDLVLRGVIPVDAQSHLTVAPDLSHILDLSNGTKFQIPSILNGIALDQSKLVTDVVCADIFIHNKGFELKAPENLPYPQDSEIIWLAPPLTFRNKDSLFAPAVSVFFYQPVEDSRREIETSPLILTGISKKHPTNDIYIQAVIDDGR